MQLAFQAGFQAYQSCIDSDLLTIIIDFISDIFNINSFDINNFSLSGIEHGQLPEVCLDATVLDIEINVCLDMDLEDLFSGNAYQALKNV